MLQPGLVARVAFAGRVEGIAGGGFLGGGFLVGRFFVGGFLVGGFLVGGLVGRERVESVAPGAETAAVEGVLDGFDGGVGGVTLALGRPEMCPLAFEGAAEGFAGEGSAA